MQAVDHEVVAGVDHRHHVGRVDDLDDPPQQPGRPDPAGQRCDGHGDRGYRPRPTAQPVFDGPVSSRDGDGRPDRLGEGCLKFGCDVVIVGGCGRVGLPLGLAFADRGLDVGLYDINAAAVDAGQRRHDALPRGRRRRGAGRGDRRPAAGHHRPRVRRPPPSTWWWSSAPRSTSTSTPTPTPCPTPSRPRCRTSATASSSCCAAPSTPASPPWSSGCVERSGMDVDVAFCPERIAEGKAMTELYELPQIVSARDDQGRSSGPPSCSATSPSQIVPLAARGGRAGQAVHQHLALHQVRHRQPALHDRQRLRPRLRAHPPGHGLRLPAGRRPARRRLRRRAVPAQGHDAAGRVQQQQLHARPRQHDDQRGPAALPGRTASSRATTWPT